MAAGSLPRVPEGLRDMMKVYTKEVLREKPKNLIEFSLNYFQRIAALRTRHTVVKYEPPQSYEIIIKNRIRQQVPLSLAFHIIPENLTDLIKRFIKAVLKENPENLLNFAVKYFQNLRNDSAQLDYTKYAAYEKYTEQSGRMSPASKVTCSACGRKQLKSATSDAGQKQTQFEELHKDDSYLKAVFIIQKYCRSYLKRKAERSVKVNSVSTDIYKSQDYLNAVFLIQRQFRRYLSKKRAKKTTELTKTSVESYHTVQYIKAINVIQRYCRQYLSKKKAQQPSIKSTPSPLDRKVSLTTAAIIIQRAFKRMVKARKAKKHTNAELDQSVEINDNASDAASYTSASTALLSTESVGEHFEFGNTNYEEEVHQQTIKEDEEVENDDKNQQKEYVTEAIKSTGKSMATNGNATMELMDSKIETMHGDLLPISSHETKPENKHSIEVNSLQSVLIIQNQAKHHQDEVTSDNSKSATLSTKRDSTELNNTLESKHPEKEFAYLTQEKMKHKLSEDFGTSIKIQSVLPAEDDYEISLLSQNEFDSDDTNSANEKRHEATENEDEILKEYMKQDLTGLEAKQILESERDGTTSGHNSIDMPEKQASTKEHQSESHNISQNMLNKLDLTGLETKESLETSRDGVTLDQDSSNMSKEQGSTKEQLNKSENIVQLSSTNQDLTGSETNKVLETQKDEVLLEHNSIDIPEQQQNESEHIVKNIANEPDLTGLETKNILETHIDGLSLDHDSTNMAEEQAPINEQLNKSEKIVKMSTNKSNLTRSESKKALETSKDGVTLDRDSSNTTATEQLNESENIVKSSTSQADLTGTETKNNLETQKDEVSLKHNSLEQKLTNKQPNESEHIVKNIENKPDLTGLETKKSLETSKDGVALDRDPSNMSKEQGSTNEHINEPENIVKISETKADLTGSENNKKLATQKDDVPLEHNSLDIPEEQTLTNKEQNESEHTEKQASTNEPLNESENIVKKSTGETNLTELETNKILKAQKDGVALDKEAVDRPEEQVTQKNIKTDTEAMKLQDASAVSASKPSEIFEGNDDDKNKKMENILRLSTKEDFDNNDLGDKSKRIKRSLSENSEVQVDNNSEVVGTGLDTLNQTSSQNILKESEDPPAHTDSELIASAKPSEELEKVHIDLNIENVSTKEQPLITSLHAEDHLRKEMDIVNTSIKKGNDKAQDNTDIKEQNMPIEDNGSNIATSLSSSSTISSDDILFNTNNKETNINVKDNQNNLMHAIIEKMPKSLDAYLPTETQIDEDFKEPAHEDFYSDTESIVTIKEQSEDEAFKNEKIEQNLNDSSIDDPFSKIDEDNNTHSKIASPKRKKDIEKEMQHIITTGSEVATQEIPISSNGKDIKNKKSDDSENNTQINNSEYPASKTVESVDTNTQMSDLHNQPKVESEPIDNDSDGKEKNKNNGSVELKDGPINETIETETHEVEIIDVITKDDKDEKEKIKANESVDLKDGTIKELIQKDSDKVESMDATHKDDNQKNNNNESGNETIEKDTSEVESMDVIPTKIESEDVKMDTLIPESKLIGTHIMKNSTNKTKNLPLKDKQLTKSTSGRLINTPIAELQLKSFNNPADKGLWYEMKTPENINENDSTESNDKSIKDNVGSMQIPDRSPKYIFGQQSESDVALKPKQSVSFFISFDEDDGNNGKNTFKIPAKFLSKPEYNKIERNLSIENNREYHKNKVQPDLSSKSIMPEQDDYDESDTDLEYHEFDTQKLQTIHELNENEIGSELKINNNVPDIEVEQNIPISDSFDSKPLPTNDQNTNKSRYLDSDEFRRMESVQIIERAYRNYVDRRKRGVTTNTVKDRKNEKSTIPTNKDMATSKTLPDSATLLNGDLATTNLLPDLETISNTDLTITKILPDSEAAFNEDLATKKILPDLETILNEDKTSTKILTDMETPVNEDLATTKILPDAKTILNEDLATTNVSADAETLLNKELATKKPLMYTETPVNEDSETTKILADSENVISKDLATKKIIVDSETLSNEDLATTKILTDTETPVNEDLATKKIIVGSETLLDEDLATAKILPDSETILNVDVTSAKILTDMEAPVNEDLAVTNVSADAETLLNKELATTKPLMYTETPVNEDSETIKILADSETLISKDLASTKIIVDSETLSNEDLATTKILTDMEAPVNEDLATKKILPDSETILNEDKPSTKILTDMAAPVNEDLAVTNVSADAETLLNKELATTKPLLYTETPVNEDSETTKILADSETLISKDLASTKIIVDSETLSNEDLATTKILTDTETPINNSETFLKNDLATSKIKTDPETVLNEELTTSKIFMNNETPVTEYLTATKILVDPGASSNEDLTTTNTSANAKTLLDKDFATTKIIPEAETILNEDLATKKIIVDSETLLNEDLATAKILPDSETIINEDVTSAKILTDMETPLNEDLATAKVLPDSDAALNKDKTSTKILTDMETPLNENLATTKILPDSETHPNILTDSKNPVDENLASKKMLSASGTELNGDLTTSKILPDSEILLTENISAAKIQKAFRRFLTKTSQKTSENGYKNNQNKKYSKAENLAALTIQNVVRNYLRRRKLLNPETLVPSKEPKVIGDDLVTDIGPADNTQIESNLTSDIGNLVTELNPSKVFEKCNGASNNLAGSTKEVESELVEGLRAMSNTESDAFSKEGASILKISHEFLTKEIEFSSKQEREMPCLKKSVSHTTIYQENTDNETEHMEQDQHENPNELHLSATDKVNETMAHPHSSGLREKLEKQDSTDQLLDEPVIRPMSSLLEHSSFDIPDGDVIVYNRLQRTDTRESSAQSESVIFGNDDDDTALSNDAEIARAQLARHYTIAGDDPHSIFRSVTIAETVTYIDNENADVSNEINRSSSFCLDDETSENIRKKIMAYSLSETDSDYYDPNKMTQDDFHLDTAMTDAMDTSTETESTIVSAAAKIQAGARGFLTRRRLRRASAGTKSSTQDTKASFGNDAISESLERIIEEEAARKIQFAYRLHNKKYTQGKKNILKASSLESSLAAKRQTLQRGDALQKDSNSTPENESTIDSTNPSGPSQKIVQTSSGQQTERRLNKKSDMKFKWPALRQNSMPVQIDCEVLRIIPKHKKKRIKSAELEKQKNPKKY